MNGSAFGFPAYPQQPSPAPQLVGTALQQMQAPAAPLAPQPVPAMAPDEPAAAPSSRFGQDPDPDPSLALAMREAQDRIHAGGTSRGQQGDEGAAYNAVQLARLGLSPTEIRLLQMSGGSR